MPNTSKYPKWWTRKSRAEQEEYLAKHKSSKMKVTRRKPRVKPDTPQPQSTGLVSGERMDNVTDQIRKILDGAPLTKNVPTKAAAIIDKDTARVISLVTDAVSELSTQAETKVGALSSKDKVQLGSIIKKAATSNKAADVYTAVGTTLAKLGVLTVGIAATFTVGVPVGLSLLALYTYKDRILPQLDKMPLESMIGKFVSNTLDNIKDGATSKAKLLAAVTDEEPDVIPSTKGNEVAGVLSLNTSEQIKAYLGIAKHDWANEVASVRSSSGMTWVRLLNGLRMRSKLERAYHELNVLRTKFVSTGEPTYAARSNELRDTLGDLIITVGKYIDTQTSRMPEDTRLLDVAKAIQHRLRTSDSVPLTTTRSAVLHDKRITPVYRIECAHDLQVFVGRDNTSMLLGVSRIKTATPNTLDTVPMRGRSLSAILKEFDLI